MKSKANPRSSLNDLVIDLHLIKPNPISSLHSAEKPLATEKAIEKVTP